MNAQHIAYMFYNEVRRQLPAAIREEIDERNATPEYACACATHDFIDANIAMGAAFEHCTGRPSDPASDADAQLWNDAWSIVKMEGFAD